MKRCPVCRAENDTQAKFCTHCGAKICMFDIKHMPSRPEIWLTIIIVLYTLGWIICFAAIPLAIPFWVIAIITTCTFCRQMSAERAQKEEELTVLKDSLNEKAQEIEAMKKAIEEDRAVSEPTESREVVSQSVPEPAQESIIDKSAEFNTELLMIPRIEMNVSGVKTVRHKSGQMPPQTFSSITKKTNLKKLFPLVVVDTETTGLSPDNDEIIEVSAIKYNNGFVPSSCFTTLTKPSGHIPEQATAINHITDDMVADCRSFLEVAPSLSEYIAGCNVCGHNLAFDLKFLFCGGAELPQGVKYYDTLALARRTLTKRGEKKYDPESGKYEDVADYDVENHKLTTLCDYYDIQRSDAHRSLSDCLATGKLLKCLIDDKIREADTESL